MKKNLIIIIALLSILTLQVQAQSDSISLFRAPGKSGVKNNINSGGNNLISFSLGHFVRGGTIISYERLLGKSGISVFAGAGFSLLDFWGQYSIFDDNSLLINDAASISSFEMGSIYDFGAKYNFDKYLGGLFIGAGFTSITNTVFAGQNEIFNFGSSSVSSTNLRLNYTSNELRVMIGTVNDPESRFYNEFSIGPKIRFLYYDKINSEFIVDNNGAYYNNTKKNREEVKFGVFVGWKMGVRF